MSDSQYTADSWPIAIAMLAFGSKDSQGRHIHDSTPDEWDKHLRLASRMGFTEIDPTDTWVRIGDLEAPRLDELRAVLADNNLSIPAVSTSRRSVLDPTRGQEYLAYSHRLLDKAAELDIPIVSFGFFQDLTPEQQKATWFWLADGHKDADDADSRAHAAGLIRELAEHAQQNGQQITLELYEDTYVGTAASSVRFLEEVNHEACGLNPDIGNFIRLHRPIEPVQEMLDLLLPHANYWHVKNYLRDEDPKTGSYTSFPLPLELGFINYRSAITQAVELGFRGPFLCEHYGADSIGVIAKNRDYIRGVLDTIL